ncbi:MAG: Gfo/Idh/MocA family oxidoreductase [Salinibacterium sp.]|nr:Gfo/Idh/MocA family oxidoreductase [Salinibacterium sp.]
MTIGDLKIAIVGAGRVARDAYLPHLAADPSIHLGFSSRSEERAEQLAAAFGGVALATDAALAAWHPDIAFVLTPEQARYSVASSLIALGVPRLFLEKPLVAANGQERVTEQDYVDGRSLLAAADSAGCETAMIFNYRYFEHVQRARELAATFGAVTRVGATTHYACWSHCIDLIAWFTGGFRAVTATSGETEFTGAGMTAPDIAAAFTLESGAVGTLLGTAGRAWQHPLFDLSIDFERGRVRLSDIGGHLEVFDDDSPEPVLSPPASEGTRWDRYRATFRASIDAYLHTVRTGEAPPIPGADGLRELQFEAGIKRSLTEGRRVNLTDL